jgi:hypothetical protein
MQVRGHIFKGIYAGSVHGGLPNGFAVFAVWPSIALCRCGLTMSNCVEEYAAMFSNFTGSFLGGRE